MHFLRFCPLLFPAIFVTLQVNIHINGVQLFVSFRQILNMNKETRTVHH